MERARKRTSSRISAVSWAIPRSLKFSLKVDEEASRGVMSHVSGVEMMGMGAFSGISRTGYSKTS